MRWAFLDSVYRPGNQLHARLPVFTSQAITKQALDSTSFYLPTIAKTVTACSNVLESALHGNKSYNSYSQLIARLLLPYCLLGNRSKVSNAAQLRSKGMGAGGA